MVREMPTDETLGSSEIYIQADSDDQTRNGLRCFFSDQEAVCNGHDARQRGHR